MRTSATMRGGDMAPACPRLRPGTRRPIFALDVDAASSATSPLMEELLDIREVVRRTGLTSRALRFYEARGLVVPLRTNSGRRLYGAAALERINQIVALKRAGLTL